MINRCKTMLNAGEWQGTVHFLKAFSQVMYIETEEKVNQTFPATYLLLSSIGGIDS